MRIITCYVHIVAYQKVNVKVRLKVKQGLVLCWLVGPNPPGQWNTKYTPLSYFISKLAYLSITRHARYRGPQEREQRQGQGEEEEEEFIPVLFVVS